MLGKTKKTAEKENCKSHQVCHDLKIEKRFLGTQLEGWRPCSGRARQASWTLALRLDFMSTKEATLVGGT